MSIDTQIIAPPLSLDQAKTILSEGKTAAAEKDYDKAIELFGKVIEVFEVQEEWEAFMEASYELLRAYKNDFFFTEFYEAFEKVIDIHEEKCPRLFTWKARLYREKGEILYLSGRSEDALQCFHIGQQILEENQIENEFLIYILFYQVGCYSGLGDFEKATQLWSRAAELLKEEKEASDDLRAEFHYKKGGMEQNLGNHDLAHQHYQKAYELYSSENELKKALCQIHIGFKYHQRAGGGRQVLDYFKSIAKPHKDSTDKRSKFQLANVYIYIGFIYANTGEFQQALNYYESVLALLEGISEQLCSARMNIYFILGQLFAKKQGSDKAFDYYNRALTIGEQIFTIENQQHAKIHSGLEHLYQIQGDFDKALYHANKTLLIFQRILGVNHTHTAVAQWKVGWNLTLKGDLLEGLQYLYRALAILKNESGDTHQDINIVYSYIGRNFYWQGKFQEALEYFQLSFIASISDYNTTEIYHLPTIEQLPLINYLEIIYTLRQKAKTLHSYFHVLKTSNPIKATKTIQAAFDTCRLFIDYQYKLQREIKAEISKLIILDELPETCEEGIDICLTLANHTENDSILLEAFNLQEQSKSLVLRYSMQDNEAKLQTTIDPKLLEQEQVLRNQIESIQQNIQKKEAKTTLNKKEDQRLKASKQEYFNAFQAHQTLIEQFERDYPKYHQLKYNLQTVSVTDLQKSLDEDTVVVSYFIGGEKGYIFAVTYDEYEVIPFDLPKDFDQQIQDYLDSIQAQNITDFIPQSHTLYFLLIEPISYLVFDPFAGTPKNVVILPSASLNYLPFETLIREIPYTAQPAFHQLDYLLQHCHIQYHYSATLYHQSLQKNAQEASILPSIKNPASVDFLGFAPVYTSDKAATQEALRGLAEDYSRWATRSDALQDGTLAPLPFSEKEVENIEELFTQKGLKGQSCLYDTATKEHFKTMASNAKYLHIAAHGLTNDEYPKLSGIVFHPNEEATEIHDSVLSMGEMYQLQLQADLVVLSSCESGIGKLAKGEGMMAINRGFLYAGAKNVIYTLFKVLDKPSSELCEALFAEILEGKTYTEALRLAKLRLIQRADVDPKSWSGFVLLGA